VAATKTAASRNGNGSETHTETIGLSLKRLQRVVLEIPIQGTSPLIVNRWSEKAKEMMLQKQQTSARTKREPKDPVANFEASRYRLPSGADGFPATAFKAAIVHASRFFEKSCSQVLLKQSIIVIGEGPEQLVPLTYGEVIMREDTTRNATGVADLRYRAQYWPWSATLLVRTIEGQFDTESIFALVDAAGIGGVGEWRPTAPKSATGTFGCFEVAS
jgi:hypothetical protein